MCKFELKSIDKYYNINIYVNIINEISDKFKNNYNQSCSLEVLHENIKTIQNISDIIVEYYNYSKILEKLYLNNNYNICLIVTKSNPMDVIVNVLLR